MALWALDKSSNPIALNEAELVLSEFDDWALGGFPCDLCENHTGFPIWDLPEDSGFLVLCGSCGSKEPIEV
jgi:hypothetical protein